MHMISTYSNTLAQAVKQPTCTGYVPSSNLVCNMHYSKIIRGFSHLLHANDGIEP